MEDDGASPVAETSPALPLHIPERGLLEPGLSVSHWQWRMWVPTSRFSRDLSERQRPLVPAGAAR